MGRRYVDFEIIKEAWNKYDLQDGTMLKARTTLQSVWLERDGTRSKHSVEVSQNQVWMCDPALQGAPDTRKHTQDQLKASIEIQRCAYTTMQYEPSEYILDDGTHMVLHNTLINIARTGLFNHAGDRIYIATITGHLNVTPAQQRQRQQWHSRQRQQWR